MADNQFDMEPYCIKHQAYVITCKIIYHCLSVLFSDRYIVSAVTNAFLFFFLGVEGNPYIMNNGKHQDLHIKRTSSCVRGGVIKSQERTEVRRVSQMSFILQFFHSLIVIGCLCECLYVCVCSCLCLCVHVYVSICLSVCVYVHLSVSVCLSFACMFKCVCIVYC